MIENALSHSIYSGNGMGQHYTDPEHEVVRRAVDLVKQTGGTTVMDIACGRGLVSRTLAHETDATQIIAFDINEPAVSELKAVAASEMLPITGSVFDAASPDGYTETGISPRAVDVVIAKDVYPFLNPEDGRTMLRNISDVISPEGWLLITAPSTRSRLYRESVPTEEHLYRRIDEEAKAYIQTDLNYFTFTTIESMARLMREVGIDMTEARHYGRAHGWIIAVGQKIPEKSYAAAGISDS